VHGADCCNADHWRLPLRATLSLCGNTGNVKHTAICARYARDHAAMQAGVDVWIGDIRDPTAPSRWKRSNGQLASVASWCNGEPNNLEEKCAYIRQGCPNRDGVMGSNMNDGICDHRAAVLCVKPGGCGA
jgi:hypothetical protein